MSLVRLPIEIRSTPVSAIARMVVRSIPPDASSTARPAVIFTASCNIDIENLSNNTNNQENGNNISNSNSNNNLIDKGDQEAVNTANDNNTPNQITTSNSSNNIKQSSVPVNRWSLDNVIIWLNRKAPNIYENYKQNSTNQPHIYYANSNYSELPNLKLSAQQVKIVYRLVLIII